MRRHDRRHAGYVLLLTLGIIALASIALAGLAQHSLRLAASANQSTVELQARWGILSIRHVLLVRAADIIEFQVPDDQASQPPWPKPAQVTANFALGGQQFEVVVADEDAKLNLGTIYARQRERLLPAIRQMSRDADAATPNVRLRPNTDSGAPFTSWGQVFELAKMPMVTSDALASIGREMTCWGSGRLNLRRASDAAIRETASIALSSKNVGQLIQLRKNWGGQGIDELLDGLGLRRPQYLAARRLLETESRNYSLSVVVDDGQRERSYLFVDGSRPVSFAW